MAKIAIDQKNLAIALLIALAFQYLTFANLPHIGRAAILVVALLLLLK